MTFFKNLVRNFTGETCFFGVYDKITDEEDHEVGACKGDTIYHAGFNLLLARNSKSTNPINRSFANKVIENVESSKVRFWIFKSSLNASLQI